MKNDAFEIDVAVNVGDALPFSVKIGFVTTAGVRAEFSTKSKEEPAIGQLADCLLAAVGAVDREAIQPMGDSLIAALSKIESAKGEAVPA